MLKTAVECLRFDSRAQEALENITEERWSRFLSLTDRTYLTLPIAARWFGADGPRLATPPSVRRHMEQVVAKNTRRHETLVDVCREISDHLQSEGMELVFLKGLTQSPWYCDSLSLRPQFDIDLYCPESAVQRAYSSLTGLGFEALKGGADLPTDHLPPLVRRTPWRWRGDYYDPEMPLTVEVHRTLWDADRWGFSVHGADAFWERRTIRQLAGLAIPALDPVDGLSYTAWHVLRHLLGGDLRPYHVYELAHFLDRSAGDAEFWNAWREHAEPEQRIAESTAFRLAALWFGCRVHPVVSDYMRALPANLRRWFNLFSHSPLEAVDRGNKDALILHLCLARPFSRRLSIAARRIAPRRLPPRLLYDNDSGAGAPARAARMAGYLGRVLSRAVHHGRAAITLSRSTLRWFL